MKMLIAAAAAGLTLATASAATADYYRYTVSGVDTGSGIAEIADPFVSGEYNISVHSSGGVGEIDLYVAGTFNYNYYFTDGSLDFYSSNNDPYFYENSYYFPSAPRNFSQVVTGASSTSDVYSYYPNGIVESYYYYSLSSEIILFGGIDAASGAYVPMGNYTVTVSSVPEPADWSLLLIGFGALGLALRRRASTSGTPLNPARC